MDSPIEILLHVARLLDEQSISYVAVGSVVSSLYGDSRATADVDIVADIKVEQIPQLLAALQERFYVDEQAMHRAVRNRRLFNAIHFDSLFKVDIYVLPPDGFNEQQLARRQPATLLPDSAQAVYLASPEDVILAKLRWYRQGGKVSERQLADVVGVIKVQSDRLDVKYLREWADKLSVRDLLDKALNESL
jgi:hypothetical protein